MKLNSRAAITLSTLLALSTVAAADTLDFDGTASSTCSLTDSVDGTIGLGADLRSWSTSAPATIRASNTAAGTFVLSVTRAENWAESPAGTPITSFSHLVSMTGANSGATFTSAGETRSAPLAAAGVDDISVSLTATATDPFRAGAHKAQVTVTCAPE